MKNNLFYFILFLYLLTCSCAPVGDVDNPLDYKFFINISSDTYPAASPDGKWIAYYHKNYEFPESEDYPTGLYIIDKDGYNRRLLLKGDHVHPSWSPDSKWIVFSNTSFLKIINLEGDSIRTYQGQNDEYQHFPDWSKDGKHILFYSFNIGAFICDPNLNETRQLFKIAEFRALQLKWGPNGYYICSSHSDEWEFEEIIIVDTLFNDVTRLTFSENVTNNSNPVFSPISNSIAWSNNLQIHRMDVDGSNQKRLDYGDYPAWTADGKQIIYSYADDSGEKAVLFRIDIDGSNKKQLTY